MRRQLEHHRGRAVKSLGDGFLATFDGPARGIRCAWAIREQVRRLGVEIRAGLHTVNDLVVGSGIEFRERGSHQLKGVPGEWRLYAAAG